MEIGDIYIKFKNIRSTRTEMCCLASDLHDRVEHFVIKSRADALNIPGGFYLLQRVNTKPDIPDGKLMGYHFKIEDGVMKRWYLICDGADDKQLFVVEDYEDAVQDFLDNAV